MAKAKLTDKINQLVTKASNTAKPTKASTGSYAEAVTTRNGSGSYAEGYVNRDRKNGASANPANTAKVYETPASGSDEQLYRDANRDYANRANTGNTKPIITSPLSKSSGSGSARQTYLPITYPNREGYLRPHDIAESLTSGNSPTIPAESNEPVFSPWVVGSMPTANRSRGALASAPTTLVQNAVDQLSNIPYEGTASTTGDNPVANLARLLVGAKRVSADQRERDENASYASQLAQDRLQAITDSIPANWNYNRELPGVNSGVAADQLERDANASYAAQLAQADAQAYNDAMLSRLQSAPNLTPDIWPRRAVYPDQLELDANGVQTPTPSLITTINNLMNAPVTRGLDTIRDAIAGLRNGDNSSADDKANGGSGSGNAGGTGGGSYAEGATINNGGNGRGRGNNGGSTTPASDLVSAAGLQQAGSNATVGDINIRPTVEDLADLTLNRLRVNMPDNMRYDYNWGMNEYADALNRAKDSLAGYTDVLLNRAADNDANSLYNIMRALRSNRASGLTSGANAGMQAANDLLSIQGIANENAQANANLLASAIDKQYELSQKEANQPEDVLQLLGGYYTPMADALALVLGDYLYSGYGSLANAKVNKEYNDRYLGYYGM